MLRIQCLNYRLTRSKVAFNVVASWVKVLPIKRKLIQAAASLRFTWNAPGNRNAFDIAPRNWVAHKVTTIGLLKVALRLAFNRVHVEPEKYSLQKGKSPTPWTYFQFESPPDPNLHNLTEKTYLFKRRCFKAWFDFALATSWLVDNAYLTQFTKWLACMLSSHKPNPSSGKCWLAMLNSESLSA